jgi:hypothetical protein
MISAVARQRRAYGGFWCGSDAIETQKKAGVVMHATMTTNFS